MSHSIDKSPLAAIDTTTLLLGFVIVIIAALFLAYRYKDTYKISKMLKMYGVFGIIFSIIFLLLKVKIVLIIGMLLMGLVVLGFRSNHYFYH
ncbi:hypothetical protein DOK76_00525 [Vagococcus sp. DIV0080]|uniref:Uncharacterized protein n=1 Tax=Candidatus Vagococcus giribetii TaxID=2230876 RepID=A0ABS3HP56_9ENTE|nr:hypothetical protein [Vagococcus sp. DIV0080]MBO0475530.1 hypothetical protein [Vagococcus sp. DIV0080]